MNRRRRKLVAKLAVRIEGHLYDIQAAYLPMQRMARVGADSPYYQDPGRCAELISFRVLRDTFDVTDQLPAADLSYMERAVRARLGIPLSVPSLVSGTAHGSPPSRRAVPSFDGQKHIDWRQYL